MNLLELIEAAGYPGAVDHILADGSRCIAIERPVETYGFFLADLIATAVKSGLDLDLALSLIRESRIETEWIFITQRARLIWAYHPWPPGRPFVSDTDDDKPFATSGEKPMSIVWLDQEGPKGGAIAA